MILFAQGKNRYWWLLAEVIAIVVVSMAVSALASFGLDAPFGTALSYGVRTGIVAAFLIIGAHEIALLFRRPGSNMGTGLNRVWSIGRTTILEAWAGRVWLLPILWLVASFILVSTVRPFDESERMPLNIKMLLSGQEWLLLIMMWVMACLSLPRERERKIIITNASKPLTRLEIVLGKMWGFSMVAIIMVLVMGLASWGILHISNWRIKSAAAQSYEVQKRDFAKQVAAGAQPAPGSDERITPPSEGTKLLSEEGALFAYNYVPVPRGNLSIVGMIELDKTPPVRYMKGGSSERAVYRFDRGLPTAQPMLFFPTGTRPYFEFYFPVKTYVTTPINKVQIRVTAQRSNSRSNAPAKPVERVLNLNPQGTASWEPDEPLELYTAVDENGEIVQDAGAVTVEVQCITPGVLLQIVEGADRDPVTNQVPQDADFNLVFRPVRGSLAAVTPQANPQMLGFERRGKEEIDGRKRNDVSVGGMALLEQAVWRFPGKDLARVTPDAEGNFDLGFILDTTKSENIDAPTRAKVVVKSFDSLAEQPFMTEITVAEKRLVRVKVPKMYLGNPDPAHRGDLVVMAACYTPGHAISMDESSCRIELPTTPFVLNLFKSEAVILLEAVLLIVISVMCSVRLGWPVAMLMSAMFFIFGSFVAFIMDLQRGSGLEQLNYRSIANPSAMFRFFDTTTGAIWKSLGLVATLVPDFTIYRPQEYIGNLQNMPMEVLLWNLLWTVLFIVPLVGVAYLLMRKQELG